MVGIQTIIDFKSTNHAISQSAKEHLRDNFDSFYSKRHNDLDKIVAAFESSDKLIDMLFNEIVSYIHKDEDSEYMSIKRAVCDYMFDECIGKSNPGWLANAMILIVRDGYHYNGFRFIKGDKFFLKRKIVKDNG